MRFTLKRIAGALAMLTLALTVVNLAAAQDRDSQLRTVRGQVLSKDDNTIAGAVVYLKNQRTQSVRTYISDREGNYRFSGLDPNVDYELHAENQDQTSSKRSVSSFDSRKDIVINLKVDKKKS